ncbi:MAG: hypothetical protein HY720_28010 [Planctomycetes bacterium]|nr:hypothetical protein [Planctomycetota bacterium]
MRQCFATLAILVFLVSPAFGETVSGTIYTDHPTTAVPIGAGFTVRLAVNGSEVASAATDAAGAFSIAYDYANNSKIAVYLDDTDVGASATQGSLVTAADNGVDVLSVTMWTNILVLTSHDGAAMTSTKFSGADTADPDDLFSSPPGNVINVNTNVELHVIAPWTLQGAATTYGTGGVHVVMAAGGDTVNLNAQGLTVAGTLDLDQGTIKWGTAAQSQTLTAAAFDQAAGTLTMNDAGDVFDVNGDFIYTQSAAAGAISQSLAAGTIRVSGTFDVETTAANDFGPTGGTVELDGSGAQSIVFDTAGDFFWSLTANGTDVSLAAAAPLQTVQVKGTFSVPATKKFTLRSAQTLRLSRTKAAFPPDTHTVNGTLDLVSGDGVTKTTVQLGDHQQLVVSGAGSEIRVVEGAVPISFSNAYVHFTRDGGAGGYSVHLADGATVILEFVKFDYLYGRSNNSNESTEATVESGLAFSGDKSTMTDYRILWFDNCLDGGAPANNRYPRYGYFIVDDADDLDGLGDNLRLRKLRTENSGSLADLRNFEKRASGDTITFINGAGAVYGEALDMDGGDGGRDTGLDDIGFGSSPTAVTLLDLAASPREGAALVEWRTGQEVDNLGFNVYRSRFPDRDWIQVNSGLILGLGDSQVGGRYAFLDKTAANGIRWYYLVEDIDVRGTRTLHGPVSAIPDAGAGEPTIAFGVYTNHGVTGPVPGTVPLPGPTEPPPATGGGTPTLAEKLLGIDLAPAGILLLAWDENGALLEILPPAPRLVPEVWQGRLETRIEMAGYSATRVAGKPEVPEKTVLLVTPWIERATATILAADAYTLRDLDLVRTRERGILQSRVPAAERRAPGASGGASGSTGSRTGSVTLAEMIEDARDDLLSRIEEDRRELLAARREARAQLAGGRKENTGRGAPSGGAGPGAPAPGGEADLYPASPVELGRLLSHDGRQLLPIAIHPVLARLSGRTASVHRRILVRVDFIGPRAAPPEPAPPSGDGLVDSPAQLRLAADAAALKIRVKRDGLYRLTREELARAGFDVSADPRSFRLFSLGHEVRIRIEGELDGVFDEGDELLFYGTRNSRRAIDNPEVPAHSDENVYWLTARDGFGLRMEELWVRPQEGGAPAPDHAAVVHLEKNAVYFPRLQEGERRDHWFDDARLYNTAGGSASTARVTYRLGVADLSARAHTARLTVALAGVTEFAAAPDHHAVVSVNGNAVGELSWDGRTAVSRTFEFPSSSLLAGENAIQIHLPGDLAGVPYDYAMVNFLELAYRRRFVAGEDRLSFPGEGAASYEATGFVSAQVVAVDLSDPVAPRFLRGLDVAGGTVRFHDARPAGGKYLLAGRESLAPVESLERNSPSSWRDPSHGADWIAIAHSSLIAGASRLADYRRSAGLATAVIDLSDLYDEFTGGNADPIAIRAFLAHVLSRWSKPAPRYALLVGDGSMDPAGHKWSGSELVPAPLVQMEYLWTASDNWYAAVLGDDELPDVALGRIPARNSEALAAAVEKILAHESAPAEDWQRRVSIVSDNDDSVYDFTLAARLAAGLFDPALAVEEIPLGALGTAETRRRILSAFQEGRLLVAYLGHGNTQQWATENLFSTAAVPGLPPGRRQGLVTAMGCMNGMYHLPQLDSLGEALINSSERGAVAFWGSTSLVPAEPQERAFRELVRLLFADRGRTVGEAVTEAKLRSWQGGSDEPDVVRSWVLLGDPATRLAGR